MRNIFATVAKLAAVAGVAISMSAMTTTVSSANDAHAYISEYLECLAMLVKNDPDRVEKCGVGEAKFNTGSIYTGTGSSQGEKPNCECGYAVHVGDDWVCHYHSKKSVSKQ